MTCSEQRVVAFLAGDLSEEEERLFDEHLLACERCWQAVQADRVARLALQQLREPAPAGLSDRVSLAVSVAAGGVYVPPSDRRRARPWRSGWLGSLARGPARARFAFAALALVVAVGALSWLGFRGGVSPEPAQVAAVAAMFTQHGPPPVALRAGEHVMVAHQAMMVRAYEMKGAEALVATSAEPFPVPASSHPLSGSSSKAWMATNGKLSMYGVNRLRGEQSMFLVAAMPMAELPQLAAELHLI
jgi:hypothetical protein